MVQEEHGESGKRIPESALRILAKIIARQILSEGSRSRKEADSAEDERDGCLSDLGDAAL